MNPFFPRGGGGGPFDDYPFLGGPGGGGFLHGGGGGPARAGAFARQYRCFPVSFIDKAELENGDKIVLPPSALDALSRLEISYPILFTLTNPNSGKSTHCGVLEFVAEEGYMYAPYWLMQNLMVQEGGLVTIKNAIVEKGNFVKFQPQSEDFLSISNPKAVLEASLRFFSCLDKNDLIPINYNNKTYWISVLDVKPGDAISIIEADVNVEFAAPVGYEEKIQALAAQQEKEKQAAVEASLSPAVNKTAELSSSSTSAPAGRASAGEERSAGGVAANHADVHASRLQNRLEALSKRKLGPHDDSSSDDDEPTAANKPTVVPFSGQGQTLRGTAQSQSRRDAMLSTNTKQDTLSDPDQQIQQKPFTPFSGQARSLRD